MNFAAPPHIIAKLRRTGAWITGLLCALAVIPAVAGSARADNPIVQTIYTADPAPLVFNGRVYLYTGHDEDASTNFTMKEWRVYSSADMVNWTDHGSPMSLATFSWATANAWAGQVIGTCTVPGTGGWQTWTTVCCPVTGATGTHDLYLRFAGGSGFLFNANWWQFSPAAGGGHDASLQ